MSTGVNSVNEGTEQEGDSRSISARPGPQKRPVLVLLGVLAALLAIALSAWSIGTAGSRSGGSPAAVAQVSTQEPKVGSVAPDFELPDVRTGEKVRLSSLRGRPVWVNFWATWCPPCKTELPRMKQMYNKYKGQGLAIVGVDMQEDPGQVKSYAENNGYDWLFVVDHDGSVTNRFFTSGIPMHFFIDDTGVIRAIHVGDLEVAAMEELLGEILHAKSSQATR